MDSIHDLLHSVETGLRCPAEWRPAIIEELRGHLADRTEALVREGRGAAEAERQAVREMGSAWLLALRLSAANGWSPLAQVLRELWAWVLGLHTVFAAREAAWHTARLDWVPGRAPHGALLALTFAFGFAIGRLARGWVWAFVLGVVVTAIGVGEAWGLAPLFSVVIALLLGSVLGARRERPTLAWLAWGTGIGAFVWSLAADPSTMRYVIEETGAFTVPRLMTAAWLFWVWTWSRGLARGAARSAAQ